MKDYSIYIASVAALTGILTYVWNKKNATRHLRNEFGKRQAELVGQLVELLNRKYFQLTFATFKGNSSAGSNFTGNIFELELVNVSYEDSEFFENEICFSRNCNQLFDISSFLINPHLPVAIASELEKFYARHTNKISWKEIDGKKIIVIDSGYYEKDPFDNYILDGFIIRSTNAFAFANFENLIQCSRLLRNSIENWLRQNKITGININTQQIGKLQ